MKKTSETKPRKVQEIAPKYRADYRKAKPNRFAARMAAEQDGVKYKQEIEMNTIQVDLSIDQIRKAVHRLPAQEKIALWRLLDKDLDRPAIARRFEASVQAIRKAYAKIDEDQVMKDAVKATRQIRKARHAKSRS